MKQKFRAHPLMVLSNIRPFLLVLLIPVVRGLVQYLKDRQVTPILRVEVVLFSIICVYGVVRWWLFSLECDGKTVILRDGIFITRRAVIPVSGLSSVQSEQTPLDFIFRSVTYRINTEAGNRNATDYSFKLSRRNSHKLSDMLYGKKKGEPVRFSPIKIAILSAATSSAFTGIMVIVPTLNSAVKLAGLGVTEVLEQISSVSGKFKTYFPPIVNSATLVLLCGFIFSFCYSFLRYINFRLFLNDDRIEVRSGFFVMLRTSFKKKAVNNVKIEQTFLMLLLRRYAMKVNVGGYGESKSESQVLIPCSRYKPIKEMFSDYFPFLEPQGRHLKSKLGLIHENRYLFWAEIFYLILIPFSVSMGYRFDEFGRFIAFVTLFLGAVILYYAFLCRFEYKFGQVRLGSDTVYARGKKGLRTCRLYCPKERIGEIKLYRYPPDAIFKTCNIKITVRSETAENITVRHLDYETLRQEIFDCYGITE